MESNLREQAINCLNNQNVKIKNDPRKSEKTFFGLNKKVSTKKVTIIIASYNAEEFIRKTIDSVISQSIGFKYIQLIIVDDCSTDRTQKIINEYAEKYKNICVAMLNENNGSPGLPRNIGIELANTEYVMFLDADDRLDSNGVEALYDILEASQDDYVVGKTIKEETKGTSVIGEYASVKERRNISPFSIPHFFYHMGPTARMMRLRILNENDIRFPNMKFAEDKLFFIGVFVNVKSVSTTTAPIYYANRLSENGQSLTKVTNMLDKRQADLKVIDYVKALQLPEEQEKVILNRIYEYDILRSFNSKTFINAKDKRNYFDVLHSMMETTKDLRYNFRDQITNPLFLMALKLFELGREEDFSKLLAWYKTDNNKKYIIQDGIAYYEVPFFEDEFSLLEIQILAQALDSYVMDGIYVLNIALYGRDINDVNHVVIRDRADYKNEIIFPIHVEGNTAQVRIGVNKLENLKDSFCTIFIRYNEYQLANIKRINQNLITHNKKKYAFYTSVANNLSLSIKPEDK